MDDQQMPGHARHRRMQAARIFLAQQIWA